MKLLEAKASGLPVRAGLLVVLLVGGGGCGASATDAPIGIRLEDLQTWQRHGEPVLRDYEPGGYQAAADPHVFRTPAGELRMVYSGPGQGDRITIKLATASEHSHWTAGPVLLAGSNSGGLDLSKETSFYRLDHSGKHQVYYIGYADESTYRSQIFMAEADALEGPYSLPAAPIIATGVQGGHEVAAMTSPSIVEHAGRLYMVYCAWNAYPEPTQVWTHGAISDDDGKSWQVQGEVAVPVCMEGSLTKGPDGLFYAVAQVSGDAFSIGRSDHPWGPYEMLPEPVMTAAGAPWEVDEMNTPELFFSGDTVYLYYSGADFSRGWWIMLASTKISH